MGTYTIQPLTLHISRFSPGLTDFWRMPRITLVGSYKSKYTYNVNSVRGAHTYTHIIHVYKSYIPQMGNESRCRSFACKLSPVHENVVYTDPRD